MNEVYTQERTETAGTSFREYPVTTGEWFITMLITAIPIVGLIMLFVWAFGSGTNTNKANWAKASLIWMLIAGVIGFLFFGVIFAALFSRYSNGM